MTMPAGWKWAKGQVVRMVGVRWKVAWVGTSRQDGRPLVKLDAFVADYGEPYSLFRDAEKLLADATHHTPPPPKKRPTRAEREARAAARSPDLRAADAHMRSISGDG